MACLGVNRMDLEKMESANNEETRGKSIGLSSLAPVPLCSLTKIVLDQSSVLPCSHFALRGYLKCGSHTLQST